MQRAFSKTYKDLLVLTLTTLIITFLVWLPHLLGIKFLNLDFSNGFNTIYRNFDGIEYIIIAKSLYNPDLIALLPQSLPDIYYAAHFPGYAMLILLFAPFLGFLKSMLFVAVLFTILSVIMFYFLVRDFKLTSNPLFLSIVFLILPARWLIVHSVGSAETVFIFFTLASIYFFMKFEESFKYQFILLSSLFAAGAQFTRPPGILLFGALGIFILWRIFIRKISFSAAFLRYLPLIFVPITLLGIFYWYQLSYNDFWAYFHTGDNIHLTFPPFQVFNKDQSWVGEIWLEDIIYILIFAILGTITLFKKGLYPIAFFCALYILATSMVAHRDISRYILPVFPFILIAFEKILVSKEFKIVLAILALAFYLYTQNFLIANVAPFPNLEFFN